MKLLTIVFCFITSLTFAQDFSYKIDPKTKRRTESAFVRFGDNSLGQHMAIAIHKMRGIYVLVFISYDKKSIIADEDVSKNTLKFTFQSDSTIVLNPNKASSISKNDTATTFTIGSIISPNQLKYFSENRVSKFKIGTGYGKEIDIDEMYMLDDDKKNQIRKAADYIRNIKSTSNEN